MVVVVAVARGEREAMMMIRRYGYEEKGLGRLLSLHNESTSYHPNIQLQKIMIINK